MTYLSLCFFFPRYQNPGEQDVAQRSTHSLDIVPDPKEPTAYYATAGRTVWDDRADSLIIIIN